MRGDVSLPEWGGPARQDINWAVAIRSRIAGQDNSAISAIAGLSDNGFKRYCPNIRIDVLASERESCG